MSDVRSAAPQAPADPIRVPPFLWCTDCRAQMRAHYYALEDRPVCPKCRPTYAAKIARGSGRAAMMRAFMYGLGACLASAIGFAVVISIVGAGRIILAIGIGMLVGRAINRATGSFYDRRYQYMAVAFTYAAVALGTFLPVLGAIPGELREERKRAAAAHAAALEQSTARDVDPTAALEIDLRNESVRARAPRVSHDSPEQAAATRILTKPNALARLVSGVLTFLLLPLYASLTYGLYAAAFTLLALGYGIRKAWETTADAVSYSMTGPHRIGTGPIPTTF